MTGISRAVIYRWRYRRPSFPVEMDCARISSRAGVPFLRLRLDHVRADRRGSPSSQASAGVDARRQPAVFAAQPRGPRLIRAPPSVFQTWPALHSGWRESFVAGRKKQKNITYIRLRNKFVCLAVVLDS